ncbi:MAG: hypothetical protein KDC95_03750 [Planctomycetes bacterium]|nr:hypothetical protein [Planctomycetota bacterium]
MQIGKRENLTSNLGLSADMYRYLLGIPVAVGVATIFAPAREAPQDTPRFLPAQRCALCHDQAAGDAMRDEKGRSMAPFDLWQSSMMANSARDPLWRAAVRAEIATSPEEARPEIEALCTRCHAPMAKAHAHDVGSLALLDGGVSAGNADESGEEGDRAAPGAMAHLARDGVSCTVCHQITDKGFGTDASFAGHFEINDEHRIYGPHESPFMMPMFRHTGKRATESAHILKSELCATCHTLVHDTRDGKGEHTEQSPYLEWRNSEFRDTQSCQDCHVPTKSVDGLTLVARIVHRPNGSEWNTQMRVPFGRHVFVGGNTLLPPIFMANREELGVQAPDDAFRATLEATRAQLRESTAKITIGALRRDGGRLEVPVEVKNECGHKFPTGYPSRRAWLHVRVVDAGDRVVFESGGYDEQGRIVDADAHPLASEAPGGAFEPHHDRIDDPAHAQIYEAIQRGQDGKDTWRLLDAHGYVKDNRLLPRGYSDDHADANRTRPIGTDGDRTFEAGKDLVTFVFDAPADRGPYRIDVELVYQTLAPRYAAELFAIEGKEIRTFERMWKQAKRTPEVVATANRSSP